MDATVAEPISIRTSLIALFAATLLVGCNGRGLIDDNPVFVEPPPRRALTNSSSTVSGQDSNNVIRPISSSKVIERLEGNTIVAEVNGKPIFVDDLVGSIRVTIDSNAEVPPEAREQILRQKIQEKLENYISEEIAVQALNQSLPADRQAMIDENLEEPFQQRLAEIRERTSVSSNAELETLLARDGLSIPLLRESFLRSNKAMGYLSTLVEEPKIVDRQEMVDYYNAHREDYTTPERVRWQELSVDFARHGGREGAEAVMQKAIGELQSGVRFEEVAEKYSDALSAEKRGNKGWLTRGTLVDKELETELFNMKPGAMTGLLAYDDRIDIFRVVEHQMESAKPFSELQQQIEDRIRKEKFMKLRAEAIKELRTKAHVTTIFDDE